MKFDKHWVMLWRKRGVKLSRFYAVGAIAFMFEACLLALNSISLEAEPYIARLFSLPAASVITWILNRKFTFHSKTQRNSLNTSCAA